MSQSPPPLPPVQLGYANRAACPFCGSQDWSPVNFTWWGGLLGPKMLHHVKCAQCRRTFNSKTGKSNMTAIILYQGIALVIFFVAGFFLFFVMR